MSTVVSTLELKYKVDKSGLESGLKSADATIKDAAKSLQSFSDNTVINIKKASKGLDDFGATVNKISNYSEQFSGVANSVFSKNFVSPEISKSIGGIGQTMQAVSDRVEGAISLFNGFSQVAQAAVAGLAAKFPALGTAITTVLGPIGLIAAGFAAVYITVKANFQAVIEFVRLAVNGFVDVYNKVKAVRVISEVLYNMFSDIKDIAVLIFNNFKAAFTGIGSAIKAILKGDFDQLPGIFNKSLNQIKSNISQSADAYGARIQASMDRVEGKIKLKQFTQEDFDKTGFVKGAEKLFGEDYKVKVPALAAPETGGVAVPVGVNSGGVRAGATQAVKEATETIEQLPRPLIEVQTIASKVITAPVDSRSTQIIEELNKKTTELVAKYSLLGDTTGEMREKSNLMKDALINLGKEGFTTNNTQVNELQKSYTNLNNKIKETGETAKETKTKVAKSGNTLFGIQKDNPATEGNEEQQGVTNAALAIANSIDVATPKEVKAAVAELNAELEKQQQILKTADNAAESKAAREKIEQIKKQIELEKQKGNIALQVGKQVLNAIREEIKAYITKAIVQVVSIALTKSGVPPPFNIALAAAAGAGAKALFDRVIPKLAVGTNRVNTDGLAILHAGEKVVPADVQGGGYSGGGNENFNVNVFGRLSGIDLSISGKYSQDYLQYATP